MTERPEIVFKSYCSNGLKFAGDSATFGSSLYWIHYVKVDRIRSPEGRISVILDAMSPVVSSFRIESA